MTIRKMKRAIVGRAAALSFDATDQANETVSRHEVSGRPARSPIGGLDAVPEDRVRKILEMVESAVSFTVRELARELHLSPSHLRRLFRHQTGVSIREWLIEQRLQRAAHLLAHSYMSVKEIAHSVGYEHASSFVRAFGRRFAQAPARYRKRCDVTKC
jgi:transcriptional regulator GlxA family with amidase domain